MKKILSIALALVMVFALVGVAQAAEEVTRRRRQKERS